MIVIPPLYFRYGRAGARVEDEAYAPRPAEGPAIGD